MKLTGNNSLLSILSKSSQYFKTFQTAYIGIMRSPYSPRGKLIYKSNPNSAFTEAYCHGTNLSLIQGIFKSKSGILYPRGTGFYVTPKAEEAARYALTNITVKGLIKDDKPLILTVKVKPETSLLTDELWPGYLVQDKVQIAAAHEINPKYIEHQQNLPPVHIAILRAHLAAKKAIKTSE